MAGRGIAWERVCNNSRNKMMQDKEIHWLAMHPPVLKIGKGHKNKKGSFLAVRTGKGPPDWIALHKGMSILGDDKDSRKVKWATGNVKKHQATAFDLHQRNGGLSCVLLRMHDYSRWVIPWPVLKPYFERRASIGIDDLEKMGAMPWHKRNDDNPNYDWLTPLLNWKTKCSEKITEEREESKTA
tara:strand:+ start:694 stop:1245 length:552 start_codon:yes stop_codon:yes gene_type:complete